MVTVHGERNSQLFQTFASMNGARGPVFDAMNRIVLQARLKTVGVFPQIMQQTRQLSFGFEAERAGKLFRQLRHRAEMDLQQLPVVGVCQPLAVRVFGCMREEFHRLKLTFWTRQISV